MVEIHSFEVPIQAYAFLGAVVAFLLILVIFYLYLNKKLCFVNCGGFPCIDKPKKKDKGAKQLGTAYAYDDQDTSSDSDDEVLRRYQQSIQRVPSTRSIRSTQSRRSHRSIASVRSTGKQSSKDVPEQDHLMSLAEQGGREGEGSTADPTEAVAASSVGEKSLEDISTAGQGDQEGPVHTYENQGFQKEVSPDEAPSGGSSEPGMSPYGEVASVGEDEHLFDVSDLQDREGALISKCGSLEVTFKFVGDKNRMVVTVHQAREIPSKDRGGANNTQVRALLLPTKKVRHKTKIRQGENPEFQETFVFNKIPTEEINNMGIRFRLYGCERMRRERMIGESVVGFASLNLDIETTHCLQLEPRSNLSHGDSKMDVASLTRSDSASSTQSMQHGGMPELLIGLAYNGTTGRLSVEVIKGSNFRNMAMNRAPDTYVKLTLMSPSGQEIARSKTSIRRGQPNPLYKETFMFQVALFQLPDVTLMVSVYNKRSMKRKEMIGWFSQGYNNSGEEELSHWSDMRESKGEQVCRWHVLLES